MHQWTKRKAWLHGYKPGTGISSTYKKYWRNVMTQLVDNIATFLFYKLGVMEERETSWQQTVFFCQNWSFLSLISDLLLAYHTASNLCCKLGSCRGVEGAREGPRHYWLCGCHLWPEPWGVYCFGFCWCIQVHAPIHSSLIYQWLYCLEHLDLTVHIWLECIQFWVLQIWGGLLYTCLHPPLELMKSAGNHGSSSLLFMMKMIVWHFVSDSHKVTTALIVVLPSNGCCWDLSATS
jgi:hypothetical protein